MTTNLGTNTTLTNVFQPNTSTINPAKQGLVFASRKLNANNQLILPEGSTPMPSLYIPFRLDSYTDPAQALTALRAMGFQYTQGLSFDETYPAPDNVNINNVTGLITLVWNSASLGLQNLISLNPVGSVTQNNSSIISTGTIKSINVQGNQTFLSLVLVTGSAGFTTANPITIDALLASQAPDPETSDMVTLAAYWFYNQYATAAKFTTSPNLWISTTVEGRDTSISPTATPITLVAPTAVNSPGDGSINLTYDIDAYNLGLLPTQYLGNTTVTQTINLPTDSTNILYHANNVFLRGSGAGNGINYSTDGINWVASSLSTGTVSIYSFYWNGSVYVATTSAGLYYSVNGITWIISNITTGTYRSVYYANTKWVAVTSDGLGQYSSDGITWSACTIPGGDTFGIKALAFGASTWILAGGTNLYHSADGITFTAISGLTDGYSIVTYADNLFQVGVNASPYLLYSADGITFLPATIANTPVILDIIYNTYLSLWITATDAGIFTSTNGVTWTLRNSSTTFNNISYNASTIIIGSIVGIYYSTDGITWTLGTGAGATGNYPTVLAATNIYLAGRTTGVIASNNGIAWATGSADIQGIFYGYTLTSTTCIINVVNVVGGVFNDATPITIVLDTSQNGGVLTGKEQISSFAVLNNIKDVTTLTVTYADFYDLIASLQSPGETANNKFNPQGYYGYSPAYINQYPISSLSTPDVTYFKASARLDIPTLYQYPNLPVVHVMETLFQNLNNEAPYNDTSGESSILNMSASTNKSTLPSDDILNQLTNQGFTAIGALSSGQMYVYRDVCTLQTINELEDTEFRFEPLQLKVRWVDENTYKVAIATATLPDGMRENNNQELIQTMTSNLKNVLAQGNLNGMLGNTDNNVSITINPNNVSRLLVSIATTIVPANSGSDMTVYFKSYSV